MGESKYEQTLFEWRIPCDDISIYPYKMAPGMIAYAGDTKRERKKCCYLKIRGVQTKQEQGMIERPRQVVMELVMDRYHIEKINYNSIEHKDWKSQAKVFINLDGFMESLKEFLNKWETFERENNEPENNGGTLDAWA